MADGQQQHAAGGPAAAYAQAAVAMALVERLERRIDREMAEIKDALGRIEQRLETEFRDFGGRLSGIERWRERVLGIAAAAATVATLVWQLILYVWRSSR